MHGLGDDESGWADALEESFDLKGLKALDASGTSGSCRFMLPRAPRRRVTCNGGATMPSWFDFLKLPLSATDADNYGCSLEEAIASCGRVHAAIDMLVSEGIPAERIMVGGFSQGGAMASRIVDGYAQPTCSLSCKAEACCIKAMLSTLTYPQRLAGVIVSCQHDGTKYHQVLHGAAIGAPDHGFERSPIWPKPCQCLLRYL